MYVRYAYAGYVDMRCDVVDNMVGCPAFVVCVVTCVAGVDVTAICVYTRVVVWALLLLVVAFVVLFVVVFVLLYAVVLIYVVLLLGLTMSLMFVWLYVLFFMAGVAVCYYVVAVVGVVVVVVG